MKGNRSNYVRDVHGFATGRASLYRLNCQMQCASEMACDHVIVVSENYSNSLRIFAANGRGDIVMLEPQRGSNRWGDGKDHARALERMGWPLQEQS